MLTLFKALGALALALWFGAMLFFAAGVAPVAFSVLPDRVLAGNVVNGAMARLHLIAYGAAAVVLVSYAARIWLEPARRMLTLTKASLVVLMLGLTLYSGLGVSPTLAEMRKTVGAIDQLPPDDPVRTRFGDLHRLSVLLMGVAMLGVGVVIVLEQVDGATRPVEWARTPTP